MKPGRDPKKWLRKKANPKLMGWPTGTLLYYGPDDKRASKAVVCIFGEGQTELDMRKWFSDHADLRRDVVVSDEIVDFLRSYEVRRVGMVETIIGCPHEEGVNYPKGEKCPQCPFWSNRDRFTHEIIGR